MEHFSYILVLLSCTVVCVWTCRRLHLPPIIGYLLVGILIGPGGLKWLPSVEQYHLLAEFGVVFLMFTLGLDFSIPRLMATKKILFGVGGIQVLICTITGTLCGLAFNLPIIPSFIIGGSLALSSTAIVIKQLIEQNEKTSITGQISINILIFQDLAAIIFLVLIPALSGDKGTLTYTFMIVVAKGIGAAIGMTAVGLWILRPLFHHVAKTHSTELFMLATLLVALSTAAITHALGLSMAFGAFMAGIMLGETEFKNQIEIDIRPFKDVLLGLFFVIIGTHLKLDILGDIWINVAIVLALIIFIKFVVVTLVAKFLANTNITESTRVGIILAHGGEFSFVLLREALDKNMLTDTTQNIIFAAIVISAIISPLMIRYNEKLASIFKRKNSKKCKPTSPSTLLVDRALEISNHVILCGFGRTGQILARFLDDEDIPWLALDLDPMRVAKASTAGEYSFYGDATHPETLFAAGLAKARMVVISFDNEKCALEVLRHVRSMRLDLPVFVRTKDDNGIEELRDAGATEVVPESLEGSVMLAAHLLLVLGVPNNKVISKLRTVHANRYENLQGFYHGLEESRVLEEQDKRRSLHSLIVSKGAQIIGEKISKLLHDNCDIKIKSIIRQGMRHTNPDTEFVLQENDVIVAFALSEEAVILEEKIFLGSGSNDNNETN